MKTGGTRELPVWKAEAERGDLRSGELDDLLAEYESIGFEDTIAGGAVKTRFKYREVSANNFG